jgi:hypothetical protein
MVTKSKKKNTSEARKSRVKVGKLQLNRETVKDLTGSKQKQIKGGLRAWSEACDPDYTKPTVWDKMCQSRACSWPYACA